MSSFKTKLVCAWMLTLFGLSLTALPLYSDLFTKRQYIEETTETDLSVSSGMSYTMMYVSPWTPLLGGCITLGGTILAGRLQRSVAHAKDVQLERCSTFPNNEPTTMKRLLLPIILLSLPVSSFADAVSIPIPDQGWSISLDAPPFARKQGKQDGPNYIYQANSDRFNLSIFVEPQAKPGGSKECYEFYWPQASRNPLIIKPTIKTSNTDQYYRVAYDVAAGGLSQRNVNYYFMFNGKWVDVHISITSPTKDDDAVITKFDKGLGYGK